VSDWKKDGVLWRGVVAIAGSGEDDDSGRNWRILHDGSALERRDNVRWHYKAEKGRESFRSGSNTKSVHCISGFETMNGECRGLGTCHPVEIQNCLIEFKI